MLSNSFLRPLGLIFSFITVQCCFGQVINGIVPDSRNDLVLAFAKPFENSNKWEVLTEIWTDESGAFRILLDDIKDTEVIYLLHGNHFGEILVQPHQEYLVRFPELVKRKPGSGFKQIALDIQCKDLNDPNFVIERFHRIYAKFLSNASYDWMVQRSSSSFLESRSDRLKSLGMIQGESSGILEYLDVIIDQRMDSLKVYTDSVVTVSTDTFVQSYLTFVLAQTQMDMDRLSDQDAQKYIARANPKFPADQRFMSAYFITKLNKSILGDAYLKLTKSVNKYAHHDSLINTLNVMNEIPDVWKAEIALGYLVRGLEDPDLNRKQCLRTLYRWSESDHSYALEANAIFQEVLQGKRGYPMPEEKVFDLKAEEFNSHELKGNWSYWVFVHSRSTSSLREYKMLVDLHKKYGRRIEFVVVFLNESEEDVRKFLSGDRSGMRVIAAKNDPLLRKSFNVKTLPECYLYNPELQLHSTYTKKPSENIELVFKSILREKPAELRFKVWDD